MAKKTFQILMLMVMVLAAFAGTGKAEAWSGCGSTYTVQWGDTLYQIAANCGTTMDAIRSANPGLYNWVYAGQVLVMPGGGWSNGGRAQGGFTYYVQYGDTLKIIAARYGTTWDVLARANQLYNPDVIYIGQPIWVPAGGYHPGNYYEHHDWDYATPPHNVYYTVQKGDTLAKIATWYVTTVNNLNLLNPQIKKSNLLDVGMVIRVK